MRRRHIAAVLGTLVLAAGCTTTTEKKAGTQPSAKVSATAKATATGPACQGGTFRWTDVTREVRLTEVSPVVKVGRSDGRITFHPRLVRTIVARVDTSDTSVSAHRVLVALAKRLKWADAEGLAAPGETSADRVHHDPQVDFLGHPGRYVEAEGVNVVEASFTVTCSGGRDVYGRVITWLRGNSGASLACGVDPGNHPWIKEAYRLTCDGATA